jgi:hypothetical protein
LIFLTCISDRADADAAVTTSNFRSIVRCCMRASSSSLCLKGINKVSDVMRMLWQEEEGGKEAKGVRERGGGGWGGGGGGGGGGREGSSEMTGRYESNGKGTWEE